MTIKKIEKLRKYFFSAPSLFGKKTEEDFKFFLQSYEFEELRRIANTKYIRPPKDYEQKLQRYSELRRNIGGI